MSRLDEDMVRELWGRYKFSGDMKARDRLILAYSPLVKYVAGRMGNGLPVAHRRGRPHQLRPARPHQRARALRSGARDQVRDVRDLAHQGLHHRRAPLARLGAALRAQQGPRDREGEHAARAPPAARPDRRRDRRRARHLRGRVPAVAHADLEHVHRRPRRALGDLRLRRRPGVAHRHARGPEGARPVPHARPAAR